VAGGTLTVEKDFVVVRITAKDGYAAAMENNVFTILDTHMTPELKQEGFAREVVSKVQQMRKQKAFEMMDNIKIYIKAGPEVGEAVDKHKAYIMKETLATAIVEMDGIPEFDVNGHMTGLDVEKV